MEWYSTNKEFKFVLNRYENRFYNSNSNYNYFIELSIYNNLNILLIQLKFSEIDILNLFWNLDQFILFHYHNNLSIVFNPDNLRFELHCFYFEKLYNNMILLKLNQCTINQNQWITIIQFEMNYNLFEEFIYEFLLSSIIDININYPDNLLNAKDKINILKNIYYNSE